MGFVILLFKQKKWQA